MGQKASQSAPNALDLSGRSSQSVRPRECNHTAVAAIVDTSAVEGFLAVVLSPWVDASSGSLL